MSRMGILRAFRGELVFLRLGLLFLFFCGPVHSQTSATTSAVYLGFDLNEYPGDAALPTLRKTFSFTGYWLGPPPGEKRSTWLGKHTQLKSQGFGFMLLFNARETRTIKNEASAKQKGTLDAQSAAALASQEGFLKDSVVFLDIEEGGRLPDFYHTYLASWIDELKHQGFRAGVYCSAIAVDEGQGASITTAQDIRAHAAPRDLVFWVYNDVCPPAPGCVPSSVRLQLSESGFPSALIWQFAQSPRRKEFTARCAGSYAADGNCYVAGDTSHKWFLDLNVSTSPDPSAPKKQGGPEAAPTASQQ